MKPVHATSNDTVGVGRSNTDSLMVPRMQPQDIVMACYPTHLNAMVQGLAYRLETYALPLRDGVFPGLSMERQFIKRLCVDGIELLELQRANGSRHVIAAAGIERVSSLGRANLEPDTLRGTPAQM